MILQLIPELILRPYFKNLLFTFQVNQRSTPAAKRRLLGLRPTPLCPRVMFHQHAVKDVCITRMAALSPDSALLQETYL